MSPTPQPGDIVPNEVLHDLIDDIRRRHRLFPIRLQAIALQYARQYLRLGQPSESALWDYIVDRLQLAGNWYYADLEDYPNRFGYAITNADGVRLYIKLMYDNQSRVRVLSFHEGY